MFLRLLLTLVCGCALSAAQPSRAPVLVELFTSEGCSSCPPADRLLEQLDPQAIVLSEHVDYWDHLGWKDAFSSHAFTQRQQDYARQLNLPEVYTPQMIVDGTAEFNGSDSAQARRQISKAAQRPKASVRITAGSAGLHVEISGAPHAASVYLALAENAASSQVAGGENQGRRLQHVAVLRGIRKVGSIKKGALFIQDVALPPASQRVIVFVQQSDQGPVEGAAVWHQ